MSECNPVATPLNNDKPGPGMGGDLSHDWDLYLNLIGSLCWIAIGTRPDIPFAVSFFGRFTLTHRRFTEHALRGF